VPRSPSTYTLAGRKRLGYWTSAWLEISQSKVPAQQRNLPPRIKEQRRTSVAEAVKPNSPHPHRLHGGLEHTPPRVVVVQPLAPMGGPYRSPRPSVALGPHRQQVQNHRPARGSKPSSIIPIRFVSLAQPLVEARHRRFRPPRVSCPLCWNRRTPVAGHRARGDTRPTRSDVSIAAIVAPWWP